MSTRAIEPYRVLFPIGIAFGLVGAGLWPLDALGLVGYPGPTHRALMMLGFEQGFVLGFLLTAMPGLTHAEPCRTWELTVAATSVTCSGLALLADLRLIAAVAAFISVAIGAFALGRRVAGRRARPPQEFVFVGLALCAGLAGTALRVLAASGVPLALPPRFEERLVSLGMVFSLVLGLGSLLVPTFAGFQNPLVIPGVAGAHDPRGRRLLYLGVVSLLVGAFGADLAGLPRLGHGLRAVAAWTMVALVWRPWRPGRSGPAAWALRVAGPLAALGVTAAAVVPAWEVGALHITFIGGFALLTLAIGTRVIVSHGHRPLALEEAALSDAVLVAMGVALVARLLAEGASGPRPTWLAVSGVAWLVAWSLWGVKAVPALLGRDR